MNGSTNRPAIWACCVVVTALSLSPFAASAQQAQPTHPLDALTGAELQQVKTILQAEGKLGPKARFHNVDLDEPDKAAVTAWRPGASLPRRAIAVVSEAGTVHQAAIDLSANRMVETIKGVKRIAAKLMHFDGAYLRFVGDLQISRATTTWEDRCASLLTCK